MYLVFYLFEQNTQLFKNYNILNTLSLATVAFHIFFFFFVKLHYYKMSTDVPMIFFLMVYFYFNGNQSRTKIA